MPYEYGGDRQHVEETEDVEEKTAIASASAAELGMLLSAGVCMKVPFSRVTIKRPVDQENMEGVDFAGVSFPRHSCPMHVAHLTVTRHIARCM